jgi:hypothetical protein
MAGDRLYLCQKNLSDVESQIKNLDELIAQTVQSVSAQNRLSTEIPPTTQQSFDTISYSSEQQIKVTSPVQPYVLTGDVPKELTGGAPRA